MGTINWLMSIIKDFPLVIQYDFRGHHKNHKKTLTSFLCPYLIQPLQLVDLDFIRYLGVFKQI